MVLDLKRRQCMRSIFLKTLIIICILGILITLFNLFTGIINTKTSLATTLIIISSLITAIIALLFNIKK